MSLNLARERARERKSSGSVERLSSIDPNQSQKRERVHTVSVMQQNNRKSRSEFTSRQNTTRSKDVPKSGINPSFVFLQLYHAASFGQREEKPMLVQNADTVQRAVKILDTIPPYETHKIGVVYVREGQTSSEVEILKNKFGSMRYVEFLQNLGTLVKLEDVDPQVSMSSHKLLTKKFAKLSLSIFLEISINYCVSKRYKYIFVERNNVQTTHKVNF